MKADWMFVVPGQSRSVTILRYVSFNDESRFSFNVDDNCRRILRQPGQQSNPVFVVSLLTAKGVIAYQPICRVTQSLLVLFQDIMTVRSYIDRILMTVVLPML